MSIATKAAVVTLGFFCCGIVAAQSQWPDYMPVLGVHQSESTVLAVLPSDVAIVEPETATPADKSRWSGIWNGWACRGWVCDVKLAVEQVSGDEATVVYSAANEQLEPFSQRTAGRFYDDELIVPLRTGSRLILRMRNNSTMEMMLQRKDSRLLAAGVLSQADPDYVRSVSRVETPWKEGGKQQTLEMVVYTPVNGSAPYPTLIFNHGSTGTGEDPAVFTLTSASPHIGRFFAKRGWQVLFPQRRGRGKSDGLYDEGFRKDRSGYSCDPELTLPGFDRAIADLEVVMAYLDGAESVDHERLLIGGNSRGGILSVAYAGSRPDKFKGVVNFVGGWVGDNCKQADEVNPGLFRRGSEFQKPMLWLYGDDDPFYSLNHSRKSFAAFTDAGGVGDFRALQPPDGFSGHSVVMAHVLWEQIVDDYLRAVVQ